MASRSYAKMVAQYRRDYPHTVTVINAREWRDKALGDQHYVVTRGPLVQWFENGESVFGFKTAEQAAAFQHWVDHCGIDWTADPRAGIPDFDRPPERPVTWAGPTPRGR